MASQTRRIGDVLRDMGLITQQQLDEALRYQQEWKNRMKFGETVVALGFLTEEELGKALSRIYRIPFVNLSRIEVPQDALDMLPKQLIERKQMIPVRVVEIRGRKTVTVALADPSDMHDLTQLEFTTGCKVIPALATPTDITDAITRYYRKPSSLDSQFTAFGLRELSTSSFELDAQEIEPGPGVTRGAAPAAQRPAPAPQRSGPAPLPQRGAPQPLRAAPQPPRAEGQHGAENRGQYETQELELTLGRPGSGAPTRGGLNMGAELELREPTSDEISLELELDGGATGAGAPGTRGGTSAAEREPSLRLGASAVGQPPPSQAHRAPAEIVFNRDAQGDAQPQKIARIQTLRVTNPLVADAPNGELDEVTRLRQRVDRLERTLLQIYQALRRRGVVHDDDLDMG